MRLPADPAQWPVFWRDEYAEREAIMAEAGVLDARSKAEADTRRRAGKV